MIEKSKAFIIKRKIYRDTSLILKVYTDNFGKVEGIVKGVRKIEDYGRYDGLIEFLSNYEIVFYRRKSGPALFVQFHLLNSYWELVKDYRRFVLCCSASEFLDYIMQPYERNIEVYKLMSIFLKEMSSIPEDKVLIMFFAFIIKLLKYSGFSPQINNCLQCKKKVYPHGFFSSSEGGLICKACGSNKKNLLTVARGTIKYMNFLEQESYSNIKRLKISPGVIEELKKILSNFIAYHISFIPASWKLLNISYG